MLQQTVGKPPVQRTDYTYGVHGNSEMGNYDCQSVCLLRVMAFLAETKGLSRNYGKSQGTVERNPRVCRKPCQDPLKHTNFEL